MSGPFKVQFLFESVHITARAEYYDAEPSNLSAADLKSATFEHVRSQKIYDARQMLEQCIQKLGKPLGEYVPDEVINRAANEGEAFSDEEFSMEFPPEFFTLVTADKAQSLRLLDFHVRFRVTPRKH